ncbi:hypothetical protein ACE0DR_11605 [Azotobacter sp. CWF10]
MTRSFGSFEEAAQEAGRSRIYGGIHFEFANQDGLALGHEVASYVLESLRTDIDVRPRPWSSMVKAVWPLQPCQP